MKLNCRNIIIALFIAGLCLAVIACGTRDSTSETEIQKENFATARNSFTTKLIKEVKNDYEIETPPSNLFKVVKYPTALGDFPAYLSILPDDGQLHPAMIWITGGWGNDIGDVWSEQEFENDQSAAAIRKAGVIMMYPSQRGGNGNKGSDENAYGEIDDIIAAAKFLAQQKGVDPKRIYLGGHSTGGTKVLLVAAASDLFRAVFSFGPIHSFDEYSSNINYDRSIEKEKSMRAPITWLASINNPTFIFEGKREGNIDALEMMEAQAKKEKLTLIKCYGIENKDHFSVLAPTYKLIADKIVNDKETSCNIDFSTSDIASIAQGK